MKKITIFLLIVLSLSSCVTTKFWDIPNNSTISTLEKDRIEILGQTEGSADGGRVWILFIPIGWGKNSWVESTAYERALKTYPNTDGLINQTKTYRRTSVPLIVITPVVKKATVKGTAYHIRSDAELDEYLKAKENPESISPTPPNDN